MEGMSRARPRATRSADDPAAPTKGARASLSRRLLRWARFRRWYVKRTLKIIDGYRAKGRPLTGGLAETARQLGRVPKPRRAQVLEEAILAESGMSTAGREFRRFAARKRLSTRSDTVHRPGRPPGGGRQVRPR